MFGEAGRVSLRRLVQRVSMSINRCVAVASRGRYWTRNAVRSAQGNEAGISASSFTIKSVTESDVSDGTALSASSERSDMQSTFSEVRVVNTRPFALTAASHSQAGIVSVWSCDACAVVK